MNTTSAPTASTTTRTANLGIPEVWLIAAFIFAALAVYGFINATGINAFFFAAASIGYIVIAVIGYRRRKAAATK